MKKKIQNKNLSRSQNSFPYLSNSLEVRLSLSKSVDISKNHTVQEENGYWKILPIQKKTNK
jgi:hypothetical protein